MKTFLKEVLLPLLIALCLAAFFKPVYMWEDNKFFSSKKKKLTKKIAAELLDKGWCRVTGLYTPKRPQLYDAVIRLDDTGGKYVSFKMEFEK